MSKLMLHVIQLSCLYLIMIICAAYGDQDMMQDWQEHMTSFLPDDMISFQVESGQDEIIIESISQATNIKGAYFTSMYSKDSIDFQIIDPKGKILFNKTHKKETVFSVNVTKIGDYQFVFKNIRSNEMKTVTFAIDIKDSSTKLISQQDIDPLEDQVKVIFSSVMDVYYENKISQQRFEAGYESMKRSNYKLMILTLIETIFIIAVTGWQMWYIKNLFDKRRLV